MGKKEDLQNNEQLEETKNEQLEETKEDLTENEDVSFGEAGIKALRLERQRVKELEAQIRELRKHKSSLNESENKEDLVTLKEQLSFLTNGNAELQAKLRLQREEFESQLNEKNKQIDNYKIKSSFEKVSMAAGLDPTYMGLYYSAVCPELTVTDGKVIHRTGVDLEEWIETNKLNYPDLFKARNPGGVNARGGGAATNGKARVSRSDVSAFFKNLDRIATGDVQVDD